MGTITIIDSDSFKLYFHEETKIVHHIMFPDARGQVLRDGLLAGTQLLKQYGAVKWLSDDRKSPGLSEEDRAWGNEVWNTANVEAGWRYWALVVPEELAARQDMVYLVNTYYDMGVRVQVFTDPDDGMKWLSEQ